MQVRFNFAMAIVATSMTVAVAACSNGGSGSGPGSGGSGNSASGGSSGASGGSSGSSGGSSGASGGAGGSSTTGTGGVVGSGGSSSGGSSGVDASADTKSDTGTGTGGSDGGAGASGTGCGVCPNGVIGHCDASANYPTYNGYALSMVEDFCGTLDLDHDPVWTWSDGAPADGATWFNKSQITFANGKMVISAMPQNQPGNYTSYSESDYNSATGKPTGRTVVSGEFRTKYNNYRYGRYEVTYKSPTANADPTKGGYLATMFLFRTPKWTAWNEVDLELEPWDDGNGGSIVHKVAGNVVDFVNTGAGVPGYPGGAAFVADPMSATYIQTDVHTYAFEWTPTSVTWYLDGKVIHSYGGGNGNGGSTPKIPNLSAKIMMNLWVFGGPHFGDPAGNNYPLKSEYDSFRFYKLASETTYPCSPTPGCLPAADTKFSQNNASEVPYP
jgi:beta-glucanase (GH16 family)